MDKEREDEDGWSADGTSSLLPVRRKKLGSVSYRVKFSQSSTDRTSRLMLTSSYKLTASGLASLISITAD